MTTVGEIRNFLLSKVPTALKMDFDNVGLLAGRAGKRVTRVLGALDITDEVIEEAVSMGAELIVSHHPLFFECRSVTDEDEAGRKIIRLLESGISAICLHTNLDAVSDGVNDALISVLGLRNAGILNERDGISRLAELPQPQPMERFLPHVQTALNAYGLRYCDAGRLVSRVGVCGGSGGGDLALAFHAGCDTFITADVKYHQFLQAKELGLNLIDAGHFCTENVVVPVLAEWIAGAFPALEVRISAVHGQTERFYV